jgi:hypothetical protein
MDDSNTDTLFRPSPEYAGQRALTMSFDLQLKTHSPPFKKKDCGYSSIAAEPRVNELLKCVTISLSARRPKLLEHMEI